MRKADFVACEPQRGKPAHADASNSPSGPTLTGFSFVCFLVDEGRKDPNTTKSGPPSAHFNVVLLEHLQSRSLEHTSMVNRPWYIQYCMCVKSLIKTCLHSHLSRRASGFTLGLSFHLLS